MLIGVYLLTVLIFTNTVVTCFSMPIQEISLEENAGYQLFKTLLYLFVCIFIYHCLYFWGVELCFLISLESCLKSAKNGPFAYHVIFKHDCPILSMNLLKRFHFYFLFVQIRQGMVKQGCSLVGWYHSHPHSQADPTLKDIDCQTSYQLRMKGPGGVYLPCLGLIFCKSFCCGYWRIMQHI